MRKYLAILLLVQLIFVTALYGYNTSHFYVTGKVERIESDYLVASGAKYYFARKKLVVEITTVRNGGIIRSKASKSDIRVGDTVVMRQDGNIIVEITIER